MVDLEFWKSSRYHFKCCCIETGYLQQLGLIVSEVKACNLSSRHPVKNPWREHRKTSQGKVDDSSKNSKRRGMNAEEMDVPRLIFFGGGDVG